MLAAGCKKSISIEIVCSWGPLLAWARFILQLVTPTSNHNTIHTELDCSLECFRNIVCTQSVCWGRCFLWSRKMIICRPAHTLCFSPSRKHKMQEFVLRSRHDGRYVIVHGMIATCLINPTHIVWTHFASLVFLASVEAKLSWHCATTVHTATSKLNLSQVELIISSNSTRHVVPNALVCTFKSG